MMIIVEYNPTSDYVVPDAEVEKYVDDVLNYYKNTNPTVFGLKITVGSEIIIQAFRVAIKEGRISHNDIVFEYNGERLPPDSYGRLCKWPKGFCSISLEFLSRLLKN